MTMHSVGLASHSAASRLQPVRSTLLALHRALIVEERRDFERQHGQVSSGAFLHALVNEPAFAWLRPLTALMAKLDQEVLPETWESLRTQVRQLLSIDGDSRYSQLFEQSPDVAYAHAATMHALR